MSKYISKSQIIVHPETFLLLSEPPKINLREHIPDEYDITGIHMEFPENLKNIKISFGNNSIIFDKDMTEYMKTFPFYLTLCKYLNVNMYFIYDNDWIDSNIEYEMVDEYIEEDDLGEEATIWNGYEYYTGELVMGTKKVPTGKKVRNILKGVEIKTPKIIFDIEKINHNTDSVTQKIRQNIDISVIREDYIENLIKNFNLITMENGNSYIDNKIIYNCGFANVFYNF